MRGLGARAVEGAVEGAQAARRPRAVLIMDSWPPDGEWQADWPPRRCRPIVTWRRPDVRAPHVTAASRLAAGAEPT